MIDFLKILSIDTKLIQKVFNNSLLLDYSVHQKDNKHFAIKPSEFNQAKYVKEYAGIYFCFYTRVINDRVTFTKLEILFKPHYYYNDNLHNANDFTAIECIKILNQVKTLFKLPTNELKIINIEFGLNFLTPFSYTDLITYIYYHERNIFQNSSDKLKYSKISFKHDKNGKANVHKMIKFYAKGLQHQKYTDINTIRCEVKSNRSAYINTLDIYTYSDLLKFEIYLKFSETLKKEFDKILIIDADNEMHNLSPKEIIRLKEYLNPIFWNKSINSYRNKFNNEKIKYFILLDKTKNNIHTTLKNIISKKLNELTKKGAISTPLIKTKKSAIFSTNIIRNCTKSQKRKCIVTGQDISRQKEGSFLLAPNQLLNLYHTNRKLYNEIKNKYLSKKWINASLEIQIKEIYHNIRNKASNMRIKQKGLYSENQIQLF